MNPHDIFILSIHIVAKHQGLNEGCIINQIIIFPHKTMLSRLKSLPWTFKIYEKIERSDFETIGLQAGPFGLENTIYNFFFTIYRFQVQV